MLSKKNIIPLVLLAFHTIGIIGLAVPELRIEFLDLITIKFEMLLFDFQLVVEYCWRN